MKKIIALVLSLSIALSVSAQIINPKNVLKRKGEDRVNQKIDQSVDKVLDSIFSPKKKSTDGQNQNTQSKSDGNTNTGSQQGEMPDLGGLLSGLNMGGKPNSQYHFSASITMKISFISSKEKENITYQNKFLFSDNMATFGVKFISSSNPDISKSMAMMEMMIMDFDQNKMFTFMNTNGQKTVMGIGFKSDPVSEFIEKENDKINITKLNQTKTIAGYNCEAYKIESNAEKDDVVMWISSKPVGEMAKMAAKMAKSSSPLGNSKLNSKNYMAYSTHPELEKMAREGRMVLGYTAKSSKNEMSEMEFVEIKSNDNFNFNTSAYKSMF